MQQLWRAQTKRGIETIQKGTTQYYLHGPLHNDEPRSAYGGTIGDLDSLEQILKAYAGDGRYELSPFLSGEFHPRIWRGKESPDPDAAGITKEWIATVRINRVLTGRLRELFGYVDPDRQNDTSFGFEQRSLLILACTEVESAWKSVLTANGAAPRRGNGRWSTEDYVRLLQPLRLAEWSVKLSSHPNYGQITPFRLWDAARPTASLSWYDSYNKVKHDRETTLPCATFGNLIEAMAAVFIMTLGQFGTPHLESHSPFHPDLFSITSTPQWNLKEMYIRPLQDRLGTGWLGYVAWTPKHCLL
jgi:hypothetical protein